MKQPGPAAAGRPTASAPYQPSTSAGAAIAVARYTSSDARYTIDRADTITFQYPNGAQTQIVDRSMWIRLIIGPGAPTAPINITLDSIRVGTVPRDSLISADGLRWTGTLEDGARLGSLAPSSRHALAEQLVGNSLRDLIVECQHSPRNAPLSIRPRLVQGTAVSALAPPRPIRGAD